MQAINLSGEPPCRASYAPRLDPGLRRDDGL